jgi:hypothetical protein
MIEVDGQLGPVRLDSLRDTNLQGRQEKYAY